MSHRNNDTFRNKPQFETNPMLNNNLNPNVPTFNSNSMGDQGFAPLNNCSNRCCNKKHSDNNKNKNCHCNNK